MSNTPLWTGKLARPTRHPHILAQCAPPSLCETGAMLQARWSGGGGGDGGLAEGVRGLGGVGGGALELAAGGGLGGWLSCQSWCRVVRRGWARTLSARVVRHCIAVSLEVELGAHAWLVSCGYVHLVDVRSSPRAMGWARVSRVCHTALPTRLIWDGVRDSVPDCPLLSPLSLLHRAFAVAHPRCSFRIVFGCRREARDAGRGGVM